MNSAEDPQLALFDIRPRPKRSVRRRSEDAELAAMLDDIDRSLESADIYEKTVRVIRQLCIAQTPVLTLTRIVEHAGCELSMAREAAYACAERDRIAPLDRRGDTWHPLKKGKRS